jgi:hypothetical protein
MIHGHVGGVGRGHGLAAIRNQVRMNAISSRWLIVAFTHQLQLRLAPLGLAISHHEACAWCGIMPCMNSTSALAYG